MTFYDCVDEFIFILGLLELKAVYNCNLSSNIP